MTDINRRLVLVGLTTIAALPARAATDHPVSIKGMKFNPAELSVSVGDAVVFTNFDASTHTGSAKDGSFETGKLAKGDSATVTIETAGDHAFFCRIHPSMKGTIHAV